MRAPLPDTGEGISRKKESDQAAAPPDKISYSKTRLRVPRALLGFCPSPMPATLRMRLRRMRAVQSSHSRHDTGIGTRANMIASRLSFF